MKCFQKLLCSWNRTGYSQWSAMQNFTFLSPLTEIIVWLKNSVTSQWIEKAETLVFDSPANVLYSFSILSTMN